jgi:RNA polymerase sigma-70 factor (ECF subfamily)
MKPVNQLHHNPDHSSHARCQLPYLVWSPLPDEKLFSGENQTISTPKSDENGWNTRPVVLPSITERDEALVAQSRAGNKEAFEQLVLHHKNRVYTLACRVLGDHGEAEDVAQETFLRAYERLADFRGEARFSTWLYRICYNLCVNRVQRINRDASNDSAPEAIPISTIESCDKLLAKEQQQLLNWALSRLKAELREVVLLYHTDHLSYEEIASVLGHPVGTVRSRLHRGRGELKAMLRPYFAEA